MHGSHALCFIASDVDLEVSGSDEDEVSPSPRESCANVPGWRLVADDVSFRIENIIVSISSESLSAGRLLIFSDNLVLMLALCRGRSKKKTLLSVMRLASGQVLCYLTGGYRQS